MSLSQQQHAATKTTGPKDEFFKHFSSFPFTTSAALAQSPSRADGIDHEKEAFFRRSMQHFVKRLGAELKLPVWVVEETTLVYVERFFSRRSYAKNDRFLVCGAAVFLSAKASDSPRPIKHVAHAFFKVKNANKPEELAALAKDPDKKLAEADLVDALLSAERALLYTMNFDVREYQLRKPMFGYLDALGVGKRQPQADAAAAQQQQQGSSAGGGGAGRSSSVSPSRVAEEDLPPPNDLPEDVCKQLSGVCMGLIPNIYKTQLPVLYPPTKVVAAMVEFLASDRLGLSLKPPHPRELEKLELKYGASFDVTPEEVQDVKAHILTLYKVTDAPASSQQQGQQQPQQAAGTTSKPAAPPTASTTAGAASAATHAHLPAAAPPQQPHRHPPPAAATANGSGAGPSRPAQGSVAAASSHRPPTMMPPPPRFMKPPPPGASSSSLMSSSTHHSGPGGPASSHGTHPSSSRPPAAAAAPTAGAMQAPRTYPSATAPPPPPRAVAPASGAASARAAAPAGADAATAPQRLHDNTTSTAPAAEGAGPASHQQPPSRPQASLPVGVGKAGPLLHAESLEEGELPSPASNSAAARAAAATAASNGNSHAAAAANGGAAAAANGKPSGQPPAHPQGGGDVDMTPQQRAQHAGAVAGGSPSGSQGAAASAGGEVGAACGRKRPASELHEGADGAAHASASGGDGAGGGSGEPQAKAVRVA